MRVHTYSIMYHRFPRVFQFLFQSVALQNIDDAKEQQETFTTCVSSGNAARAVANIKMGLQSDNTRPVHLRIVRARYLRYTSFFIDRFALSLNTLHGCAMSDDLLTIYATRSIQCSSSYSVFPLFVSFSLNEFIALTSHFPSFLLSACR